MRERVNSKDVILYPRGAISCERLFFKRVCEGSRQGGNAEL